jgi:hypothetical protein
VLGTTLWFVVVLGLLATVSIDAAAGFGRAGLHAAADHAVEGAMHDAVADYQNALQAAVAGAAPEQGSYAAAIGALPNPLERTLPPDPGADPAAPRFTISYAVTPTTLAAPACPTAGESPPSGPDTIAWLQCDAAVQESRMSLHVTVRVLDAAGVQTIAQRGDDVTLRLFAEPPFSALVGRKDAAAGDPTHAGTLAPPAHEGDLGGDTVSGASPAPGASPWPAGGTLIHVRYECHDGAGSCANAAPPDPDGALRAGVGWANGNQPPP